MAWFAFILLAAIIAVGGFWLSRFGEAIAERTGVSEGWIGLVMLGAVTSLPELVSGVSAAGVIGSAEVAVGGALGSCVFNLAILAVADLVYRRRPLFTVASTGHLISAGFGTLLLGLVALNIVLGGTTSGLRLGPVGLLAPAIVAIYLAALRTIYEFDRREAATEAQAEVRGAAIPLGRALLGYGVCAAAVVGAGLALPEAAERLAMSMGWSDTFAGTFLMAAATSLPELVVTLGALRIGAVDMAIANLLGSNLFDILILAADDLAYRQGPILSAVSNAQAATAVSAMAMNGVIGVAIVLRPRGRVLATASWAGAALIGLYALNAWAVLRLRG